jgi:hypothetical protein
MGMVFLKVGRNNQRALRRMEFGAMRYAYCALPVSTQAALNA